MRLVDALATRWGYWRGGGFTTTWFELWAEAGWLYLSYTVRVPRI